MKLNVLITGPNGFLGKNIIEALGNDFNFIFVSRKTQYKIDELDTLLSIQKVDFVIHCAAKTFIPASLKDPYDFYKFNYISTLNIAELCRVKNIKSLLYINAYPYGEPKDLPINEKHPLKPHSPYNSSKLLSEKLLFSYLDGLTKVISLRVFNVYGKHQSNDFVIPKILSQILENGEVILNDLRPKRDFLYIKDLVQLIKKIIQHKSTSGIFNVGFGKSFSMKEIVDAISISQKKKIILKTKNEIRPNEILDLYADISKVSKAFNWKPEFSILNGLNDYLKNGQ